MFLRDYCDNCDGPADVGLEDERGVTLSLRVWQCQRCGHLTVTAYNWQRGEMACAEVMTPEESADARAWAKVRETLRRKRKERNR